ncbi:MAG TPA: PadR family transcriptional regulator [Fimbriimonas sp.]|nr:PadR family transcriptional regulator [Fimbriimonas sp.]
MRKLSTIELTVLGLTWLRGPCTTYSIMKQLSLSASSFHNSRAGTAYSVTKRLTKGGFLEVDSDDLVHITPAGIESLQKWFASPIPMQDITHSADLLRLRFFFLGIVDTETRLRFIDESIQGLKVFLTKCEELLPKNEALGDYFGVLATLSSIFETKARIEWLTLVRKWVEDPEQLPRPWSKSALESLEY